MAVIIEPDKGMAPEIGRKLLELAEHPRDVQWVSWPNAGFQVPEELAVKLAKTRPLPQAEAEQVDPDVEPAPKKRGRPRKSEATANEADDTGAEG